MNDKYDSAVLVVDDDTDDRYLIRSAINECHSSVQLQEFPSAKEAWQYLLDDKTILPRVIILDLNMPDIDGFDFLTRLRATPKTKLTPCVVYTTSLDHADVKRSYELGANSYIVKPISYKDIQGVFTRMSEFWLKTALSPTSS